MSRKSSPSPAPAPVPSVVIPSPELAVIDGVPRVSSLAIAEHFQKRHTEVLRSIRNIASACPSEFNERNFALVEYADEKGEMRPMYQLSRDAFSLVAMSFTGREALAWKLRFIEAFNRMEAALRGMAELPPAPEPALPSPSPVRPRLLPVRFHDTVLYVIDHEGEPYTPLRHLAAGMGISPHTQVKKLRAQRERWGCVSLQARDDDASPCICIPLRVLPAFLLSISKVSRSRPETRERLALYQRECYETLLRRWEGGAAESAPHPAADHVFPHNGRMVTTTFAVSRCFGVPHYRVIKDLGDMILENPGLGSGVERRDSGDYGGAPRTEFILDKTVFLRLTRPYGMEADAAAFAEAFDGDVPAALPSPPPAAAPLPLPPAEPALPSPLPAPGSYIETLGLSLIEAWKEIGRLMERTYFLETGRSLMGRE